MIAAVIRDLERRRQPQTVFTITAPRGGALVTLEARAGMSLAAGATVATINGLDPAWLEVAVPEAQATAVQVGGAAAARLTAYPDDQFTGVVERILPDTMAATRTLRVRIVLKNPDGRLKAGMSAQVILAQALSATALLVPSEAVIRTGTRTLVVVEEAPGRFRSVPVELGRESADQVEIKGGLVAGAKIVASGQFVLDSEASLKAWSPAGTGATP